VNKYDDDPRYEKVEDDVYYDTETKETIFVFDDDDAERFRKAFDLEEDQTDYKMTESDWRKILGEQFNRSEWDDIFKDDSDLKEL